MLICFVLLCFIAKVISNYLNLIGQFIKEVIFELSVTATVTTVAFGIGSTDVSA